MVDIYIFLLRNLIFSTIKKEKKEKREKKREKEKEITQTKQGKKKCGTDFHIRYVGENIAKSLPPFRKK